MIKLSKPNFPKILSLIVISILHTYSFNAHAGSSDGGGLGEKATLINPHIINFNTEIKIDASTISNIQLTNGTFISPIEAVTISKDVKIITGNLLINASSKEVFDVQLKDGRTCVILDNNCY